MSKLHTKYFEEDQRKAVLKAVPVLYFQHLNSKASAAVDRNNLIMAPVDNKRGW
jgi:hypothetical protein